MPKGHTAAVNVVEVYAVVTLKVCAQLVRVIAQQLGEGR